MGDRPNCIRLLVSAVLAIGLTAPAAADKLDDIKARGRLLVGVTESSPPFSFRDDGKGIVGYDVDLAERVAKSLGVATEKIAIINAERIAALQQDRVDLVAVGMTRSKGRAKDIDFSYAYLDFAAYDAGAQRQRHRPCRGARRPQARVGALGQRRCRAQSRRSDHADRVVRRLQRRLHGACRTNGSTAFSPTRCCCCGSRKKAATPPISR